MNGTGLGQSAGGKRRLVSMKAFLPLDTWCGESQKCQEKEKELSGNLRDRKRHIREREGLGPFEESPCLEGSFPTDTGQGPVPFSGSKPTML